MSREHLYKAKRVNWMELPKEEWWVEGNLITNEGDKSKAYIGYLFDVRNGVVEDFDIVEAIPETVCEYTGLTDKNGRKIFEGDIVRKMVSVYKLGENAPCGERMLIGGVIWDSSSPLYPGHWALKSKDEHGNDATYTFDNKYEVIGNIFDNPELLEGDDAE